MSTAPLKGTFHIDNDLLNCIGKIYVPKLFEVKNMISFCTCTKTSWNTLLHLLSSMLILFSLVIHNVTKFHNCQVINKNEWERFLVTSEFLVNFLLQNTRKNLEHRLDRPTLVWWTNRTIVQINRICFELIRTNTFLSWSFLHTYID